MVTATPILNSDPSAVASAGDRAKGRTARFDAAVIAGIILLAIILRLHSISAKPFWFDEAVSVEITRLPWSKFFLALWNREANMSFYYLLLHFWLKIGGSIGFVRGLSVLFSIATLPLFFDIGKRLFDRRVGYVAAWLMAINAYHIRYAQEARSYSLYVLLTCIATWLLVRNLQEPTSARWGAYTAACVLTVYCHFFGGLVILAHGLSLVLLKGADAPWREYLRCLARFALLVSPIAVFVVHAGPGPINWISESSPEVIIFFLRGIVGNGRILLILLDAVAATVAVWSAWHFWRRHGRVLESWSFALVFVWFLFPVLTVLAVSQVQPLFEPRYLILCLPALLLIVAVGITRLRPQLLAWTLGITISAASIGGTISYYKKDFDVVRNDWPGATSFILDHAKVGDGVMFFLNLARVPFEFYRSQRHPTPQWPEALDGYGEAGLTYRDFKFTYLGELLSDASPAGDRVWLVLLYDTENNGEPNRASIMARAVFARGRRLVESRDYSGIKVLLYSREGTQPVAGQP